MIGPHTSRICCASFECKTILNEQKKDFYY
jgi:hypothetical protein